MVVKIGLLGLALLPIAGYFYFKILPRFGAIPRGEHLKRISQSPHYDPGSKKFVNQQEELVSESAKNADTWKMTKEFLFPKNQVTPKKKFPEIKPDLDKFRKNKAKLKFIWLGHSTFLIHIDGKIILVDPVFSPSAAPVDFLSPRFQDPVIRLEELPQIDAIVISHDHYDHLDSRTISFFQNRQLKFFVPLGIGAHLKKWGIPEEWITEMDWWQETSFDGLKLVCTPAQHFSGRISPYENRTLWASWVIQSGSANLYYSGDSGYGPHFKQIGEKFGPFDVTFIENGQYDDQWKPVHVHPDETAQSYFDLESKMLVPVHWGMFNLALHNWYDPIEELEAQAKERGINLATPLIGQVIDVGIGEKTTVWWKDLITQ